MLFNQGEGLSLPLVGAVEKSFKFDLAFSILFFSSPSLVWFADNSMIPKRWGSRVLLISWRFFALLMLTCKYTIYLLPQGVFV